MLVYLAGSTWNEADRQINADVAYAIEQAGFGAYLPERDGPNRFTSPWNAIPLDEYERASFETDREKIIAADVFVLLMGAKTLDEALCMKLGMAAMQKHVQQPGKYLVGVLTAPAVGYRADVPPIARVTLDQIVETPESLVAYLGRFARQTGGSS